MMTVLVMFEKFFIIYYIKDLAKNSLLTLIAYMMFVHGFKPNFRKVYKPLGVLIVMASLAIIANLNIEGANFMYLASTTTGDSIANILPPNVWLRLLIGLGLIAVLFSLISIPQIVKEVKQKRIKAKI